MNEEPSMTNQQLIDTLRRAGESVKDQIALSFLLTMAADRIERLDASLYGEIR